ncbi:14911_t:CDS:2 [Acaulospora morrowiae]|uniref:14911_t:CDS:1 n=1 Tax=Acaulospora morrowiae TaxID=94023 RepID=A0A9N9A7A2_9GLOM|nr:14911_t:CDS:2 [Acaulospora morrowiae]
MYAENQNIASETKPEATAVDNIVEDDPGEFSERLEPNKFTENKNRRNFTALNNINERRLIFYVIDPD